MILGACDRSPFLAKPGSKNAMTLLNKFGHCASNEKIIDIGIESTISQQDTLLPYQFLRDPNLCTALAWDYFDINISTLSGADSVHNTFGICYQNESQTSREVSKRVHTVRKRKTKDITKFFGMNKHKKWNPTERSQECNTFSLKTLFYTFIYSKH